MRIRIPSLPPRAQATLDRYLDWVNVPVCSKPIEVRRLDVLLVLFGIGMFVFYWLLYSWQWAVAGTLMYTFVIMCAVWLF